jgi:hypothetical protein
MPASPVKTVSEDQPAILQNARVKGGAKRKGVTKTRKTRSFKNVQLDVMTVRLVEIQKRVHTTECKMTLLSLD